MNINNSGITLETIYEPLEQFDYWEEELIEIKEQEYAAYIGKFLIGFSSLEHSLEIELTNLISDRAHDFGYMIIKDLGMSKKIDLFYTLALPLIHHVSSRMVQKLKRLDSIRKDLKELTTLRNRIAHAKWNTLDHEGFVRVDTKTDKINGLIKFKKFKLSPSVMRKGRTRMKFLSEKISIFVESIYR